MFTYLSGGYADEIHFHVRRIPIETFKDMSDEQIAAWVYESWKIKDNLLESLSFYQTGKFTNSKELDIPFKMNDYWQNAVNALTLTRNTKTLQ